MRRVRRKREDDPDVQQPRLTSRIHPCIHGEVDQQHETVGHSDRNIAEKKEERFVVPVPDTGVDPGTVVIALHDTPSTVPTMTRSRRPETFTSPTVFQIVFMGWIFRTPTSGITGRGG